VEALYSPPYWLHAALWIPLAIALPLLVLRPFKATMIALQYANGFREVLSEGVPHLRESLAHGQDLETAIVTAYLKLLARHPDSLIARKHGMRQAMKVSRRAAGVLDAGWPAAEGATRLGEEFDVWLRHPENRLNPGTTADLVTAALYAGLLDGCVPCELERIWTNPE